MNIIGTLNHWGAAFASFAWPMLWQSSLLIVIVWGLDQLLARKVPAAVRYALWLVVLVKLLLPPALALPTGAAWWLGQSKSVAPKPVAKNFTITYDQAIPMSVSAPAPSPTATPPPKLTAASLLLIGSAAASAVLLLWLGFRWWQVERIVRRATGGEGCATALAEAAMLAGLNRGHPWTTTGALRVRLKVADDRLSPAVCGLSRPVILLPRTLAEHLSREQLRTVLLHELFHLRRRDVWVNCAQAMLQIVYWWHPLLWLANIRIRRLREEAVDDAVMLALRDQSECYAPTLLKVAKLALQRPVLSLGLVGILESRSALRQRIERLMDFRAPRKAGLTFASLCSVCVFSAVALPMGGRPPNDNSNDPIPTPETNPPSVRIIVEVYQRSKPVQKNTITSGIFSQKTLDRIRSSAMQGELQKVAAPRVLTRSGNPADLCIGNDRNSLSFSCMPTVASNSIHLSLQGKLIDRTSEAWRTNDFSCAGVLENHDGMLAVGTMNSPHSSLTNWLAIITAEIVTNAGPPAKPQFQNESDRSTPRRSDGDLVPANTNEMFMRTFRLDAVRFRNALERHLSPPLAIRGATNVADQTISSMARAFLAGRGIDWEHPAGKSLFWGDHFGTLFVNATAADLDTIERAVQAFGTVPPPQQIHLKARFLEVPTGTVTNLDGMVAATNSPGQFTGILDTVGARNVLQTLRLRKDTTTLGEPEITMLVGRQAQMRATEMVTVVTNLAYGTNGDSAIEPQTQQVETGPILQVVPRVQADGNSIELDVTAMLTEFLGYDVPANVAAAEQKANFPLLVFPRYCVRKMNSMVKLADNQTILLKGMKATKVTHAKVPVVGARVSFDTFYGHTAHTNETEIVVMITATLVDSAGNRIHRDEAGSAAPAIRSKNIN